MIRRNPGKSHVYEIPSTFYSSLEAGPLQQHGTLQNFFEICLSLAIYPDALIKIENMLHRSSKERKESIVKYFHKKKMGKEMRMKNQIGDC